MKQHGVSVFLFASIVGLGACKSQSGKSSGEEPTPEDPPARGADDASPETLDAAVVHLPPAKPLPPVPKGLPKAPSPDYNPTTADKVALGALLFADKVLSLESKLACSSCHVPEHGYSSPEAVSDNASGALNQRHTPALINLAYQSEFHWDGRSKPLEAHILGHWKGQLGTAPAQMAEVMAQDPLYQAHFTRAFGGQASPERAAEALSAFIRTRMSGNAPWDQYEAGQTTAVSADVIAGAKIFNERAGCATCHPPPLYTDLGYHGVGVPDAQATVDLGRNRDQPDKGPAFKTPGLRNITKTAPYFHNGSAATLGEVLDVKEAYGLPTLNPNERDQLLLFLASLSE